MNATNKPVKTNSKEFLAHVYAYILDCIDSEAYEVETTTDIEKLHFLADTFKREFCYPDNLRRYGTYQKCLEEWIKGLPSSFNVDFENYRILEIAKQWGSIGEKASEKEQYKILSNWFNLIAAKTIQLMHKHDIRLYN